MLLEGTPRNADVDGLRKDLARVSFFFLFFLTLELYVIVYRTRLKTNDISQLSCVCFVLGG